MMVQMEITYLSSRDTILTAMGEWVIATGPFSHFWVLKVKDGGYFSIAEQAIVSVLCDELPPEVMIPVEEALTHITMQKDMMVNQLTQQHAMDLKNPPRGNYS